MVKQTLRLDNADGTFCCWLAPKEMARRMNGGTVQKVTEKGKPVRYRVRTFPPPSSSRETAAELTMFDMRMLAGMDEVQMKRIARAAQEPNPEPWVVAKLKLVQRWMGHGLIGASPVTELIAQV